MKNVVKTGSTRGSVVRSIAVVLALFSSMVVFGAHVRGSDDDRVEFDLTDNPGSWFESSAGPIAGTKSLAIASPGTEVRFSGRSHTVHTMTSLVFPTGARNMPFDTEAQKGSESVVLPTPGLYVFVCKIHP